MNLQGTYRWQESHQLAEYTNWYPGGPNSQDNLDCVWKSLSIVNPGWHDVLCTSTFYEGFGHSYALCESAK